MMQKLFEAAFQPPPRASEAQDPSRFAILPQQTEDELVLSEVHSKLDRALAFLHGNVGYSLLDDAQPRRGGGVRLCKRPPPMPAVPRGERSDRAPKVQKLPVGWEKTKTEEEIHNELQVLKEKRCRLQPLAEDGWLNADDHLGVVNSDIERLRRELATRSGSGSPGERGSVVKEEELFTARDAEARQVIVFSPDTAKYAHYPDDLVLVWRFANMIGKASASAERKVKHESLYKTVLQGVRLMHLCDYNYSDVVLTLAYASVYFQSTFSSIGHKMSNHEAAHVCVLLIYLAHSFVLDETCPLRCWQKYIFRKYCTLKVLDAALFRLFQMRGFALRITEEEEKQALSVLLCADNGFDVVLSGAGDSESTAASAPSSNGTVAGDTPNGTSSKEGVAAASHPGPRS